ncbi:lytic transglycosylase domain-containing protein [Thalassotalea maritima]|uniref:lytic transglycosylase domain-containing protein n=1 Tax=Thalassotalea maritima TaxID=3242416 RepID=UPI003527E125
MPLSATEDTVFTYRNSDGVVAFSDMEPLDRPYRQIRVGCYACKVSSKVNWHTTPLNRFAYANEITKQAKQHQVDVALVRAIIHAESHFKEDAISRVGALGLMQLMPETAKELGVTNALDAEQNIAGGVKHLAKLLQKYQGNIALTAAAYNAGEGTIAKYNGIPPFAETLAYISRVEILRQRYQQG